MAVLRYRYMAVDSAGKLMQGEIDAHDEATAVTLLRAKGWLPMRTGPAASGTGLLGWLTRDVTTRKSVRRGDVADLMAELSVMLGAGQDIDAALRFLAEVFPRPAVRNVAAALREDVRNGAALADAMARNGRNFTSVDIAMVRAGEAGGKLAESLSQLAELLDRQRTLLATLRTAMIYPSLLVVAALGAITLMLTWVLPQFVPLFAQSGAELPALTAGLMATGDFLAAHGAAMLMVLLICILGFRLALRRTGPRLWADRLSLRLPLLGALAREALAARFCRMLGMLLANGVPLIAALGIVRDATGNLAARAAIEQASLSARGGAGLADRLGTADIFPARTIHLLRLGEANARLASLSLRAAEIHEANTARGLQRLLAVLVPGLTILMGAAVALIVSALLLAMLSLNDLAS
jgi:general secretion pathway protein F